MRAAQKAEGVAVVTRRRARVVAAVALATASVLLVGGLSACSDQPNVSAAKSAGVAWVSGANGYDPAEVSQWTSWRGRPAALATTFTVRDSWQKIVDDPFPVGTFAPSKFPGALSVGQPLFPQDGNLTACARGDYDKYWAQFGRTLVRYDRADADVRLGWEFNGNWFWWGATDVAAWKTCFQKSVTAIRSTDPKVVIDWNLSAHRDTLPGNRQSVWDAYPGDAYVDIIGIDAYDSYPTSQTNAIWNRQCNSPSGLCTVIKFARAHGKKFSVPEWGLVRSAGGGGDNPLFIEKMYDTFRANADILAYEAYYNSWENGNVKSALLHPDLNPESSKEYLRLFGTP